MNADPTVIDRRYDEIRIEVGAIDPIAGFSAAANGRRYRRTPPSGFMVYGTAAAPVSRRLIAEVRPNVCGAL
jgi:hypothetical protein